MSGLEKKRLVVDRESLFSGISTAFAFCWLFLQIENLNLSSFLQYGWILSIPLTFVGFFAALITLRFLVRRQSFRISLVLRVIGVGLALLFGLVRLEGIPAFLLALVMMAAFFFTVVRELTVSRVRTLGFVIAALTFVLLFLLYMRLLRPAIDYRILQLSLTVLLPVLSFGLYSAAHRLPAPEEREEPVPRDTFAWTAVAVTLLGALASALQEHYIIEQLPVYRVETTLTGAAVFLLMLAFFYRLLTRGRIWRAFYISLTSFLLGTLLALIHTRFEPVFFVFLSLMLLFSSGAGMLLLFFEFSRRLSSPINRPAACGTAYLTSFWLIVAIFAIEDGTVMFSPELYRYLPIILTAVIILLSPALLRSLPALRAGATAQAGPDGSAAEAAPSESAQPTPPAEDDEVDFEAFEKLLTNSEKKVFDLILMGYSNQQIADELYISINTVKFHIRNVLSKIGAQRKSELLAMYAKTKQPAPRPPK